MKTRTIICAGAVLLAGCGSKTSSSHLTSGKGDAASFAIDGRSISVRQSGTTDVKVSGAPEMDYNGPIGCRGQYFQADFDSNINLYFRYSTTGAYLLLGSSLYSLGGKPEQHGGQLEWNTTVDNHQIDVRVSCPPPTSAGPKLKTGAPVACDVAGPDVARAAMGEKPAAAKSIQENADLSACQYKSVNRTFGHTRRVQVSVGTADVIKQLSSWDSQPPLSGLGDEAHGGDADLGLAVIKGKVGIEVVVDVDDPAHPEKSFAAEKVAAQTILANLP